MTPLEEDRWAEYRDLRVEAREDARVDAVRDAAPWWPKWARAARIDCPEPERDDERLF